MSANDRQVGGDHYATKDGLQHWDLIERSGLGYLEGCITKYVVRWRKKNGVQDLKKALHYLDKLIELEDTIGRRPTGPAPIRMITEFANDAELTASEEYVLDMVCRWRHATDLSSARTKLQQMIAENSPGTPEDGGQHADSDSDARTS